MNKRLKKEVTGKVTDTAHGNFTPSSTLNPNSKKIYQGSITPGAMNHNSNNKTFKPNKPTIQGQVNNFNYYDKIDLMREAKIKENLNKQIGYTRTTEKKIRSNSSNPYADIKMTNMKKIMDGKVIHNVETTSVKEYSYKEDKNFRPYMEDFCKVIDSFTGDPNLGLFLIADGHGGEKVAKYVKDRLPDILKSEISYAGSKAYGNMEKILEFVFKKIDEEILKNQSWMDQGSTACVVVTLKQKDIISGDKISIFCANVGDTRCVLADKNRVLRLSYDHKANDKKEATRIRNSGAKVFNGRVFGQLALSRSFGDMYYKKWGVSSMPYISVTKATPSSNPFLVIASDGIWDTITDFDIIDIINNSKESITSITQMIVSESMRRGSSDNISCLVIKLF